MVTHSRVAVVALVAGFSIVLTTGCQGTPSASAGNSVTEVVEYSADYPAYDTPQAAAEAADVIVQGIPIDFRVTKLWPEVSGDKNPATNPQAGLPAVAPDNAQAVVVTVTRMRVTAVIKGAKHVDEVVEVSQLGGTVDGISYVDSDTTLISAEPRASYVLMLAEHDPGKALDLLNPEQAMYVESGGKLLDSKHRSPAGFSTVEQLRSAVAHSK